MQHSAAHDRLRLGAEDHAFLVRLRAIALLLRAGRADDPTLANIEFSLRLDSAGSIRFLGFVGWDTCLLIARTAGWRDLAAKTEIGDFLDLQQSLDDRLPAAEFPQGYPAQLTLLLKRLHRRSTQTSAAAAAFLARAGWELCPVSWRLFPLLPKVPSAHEMLDLRLAVEAAGGFGPGPLATLARHAAARLAEDSPP